MSDACMITIAFIGWCLLQLVIGYLVAKLTNNLKE